MANKDLKNKKYRIPSHIKNQISRVLNNMNIQDEHKPGVKRAKDLSSSEEISYSQMKRIKNYFDKYKGDGSDDEYIMLGGDQTKKWINQTLTKDREQLRNDKKVRMDSGLENQFIRTHEKDKDNANPTKVGGMPDMNKTLKSDNIMSGDTIYQETINRIKKLINY